MKANIPCMRFGFVNFTFEASEKLQRASFELWLPSNGSTAPRGRCAIPLKARLIDARAQRTRRAFVGSVAWPRSSSLGHLSLSSLGDMATKVKLNTGAQMPIVGLGTWKVGFYLFIFLVKWVASSLWVACSLWERLLLSYSQDIEFKSLFVKSVLQFWIICFCWPKRVSSNVAVLFNSIA